MQEREQWVIAIGPLRFEGVRLLDGAESKIGERRLARAEEAAVRVLFRTKTVVGPAGSGRSTLGA